MNVLLVDDDRTLGTIVKKAFENTGFNLTQVYESNEVFPALDSKKPFEVIILDIILSNENGIDICREIRSRDISTPIIMLSSKSNSEDKVIGLNAGADDYLAKPFNPDELVARVKSVLKRVGKKDNLPKEITRKNISINVDKHEAKVNNKILQLTNTEFKLLYLLLKNNTTVTTRNEVLEYVWDIKGYEIMSNSIDVHITKLRSKLSEEGLKDVIKTIRGVGYKLDL